MDRVHSIKTDKIKPEKHPENYKFEKKVADALKITTPLLPKKRHPSPLQTYNNNPEKARLTKEIHPTPTRRNSKSRHAAAAA